MFLSVFCVPFCFGLSATFAWDHYGQSVTNRLLVFMGSASGLAMAVLAEITDLIGLMIPFFCSARSILLCVRVGQVFRESNITITYSSEFERFPPESYIRNTMLKTREEGRSETLFQKIRTRDYN